MENLIDYVFMLCVKFLVWLGDIFGLSYNAINVIIFCVIWPIFTVYLLYKNYSLKKTIHQLKNQLQYK